MSTSGPSPPGPAWSSAARSRRTGHGKFPGTGSGQLPPLRASPLSPPDHRSEDQHTARAQTGTQIIEAFLQLFQRDPASDQLIQRQLATQIMADQNRDVAVQVRRPEIAALDRLLADERARVERDPGTAGQQPDKHQLPAHIQARPRLLHRLLNAGEHGSSHLHDAYADPGAQRARRDGPARRYVRAACYTGPWPRCPAIGGAWTVLAATNELPAGPARTAACSALPASNWLHDKNHCVQPASHVPATRLPVTITGSTSNSRL